MTEFLMFCAALVFGALFVAIVLALYTFASEKKDD